MMIQHTPAPWVVKPFLTPKEEDDPLGVYVIEGAKEKLEALYFDSGLDIESEDEDAMLGAVHAENEANALLISAAPALYGLLRWITRCAYFNMPGDIKAYAISDEVMNRAMTLIKTLEGA